MELLNVMLKIGDDLVSRDKAVWMPSSDLQPRQRRLPIGSVESERIPTVVEPDIARLRALLQDDVRPLLLAQVVTDRESRLPATNDDGFNVGAHVDLLASRRTAI